MTFQADAGRPYRLWIRAKAAGNNWANDSVHVQFSDTVTASGAPGSGSASTSAAEVNLEDCSACGVSRLGLAGQRLRRGDVSDRELRFATTGPHTIRVQVREDGIGIDQIVLSADAVPDRVARRAEERLDDPRAHRAVAFPITRAARRLNQGNPKWQDPDTFGNRDEESDEDSTSRRIWKTGRRSEVKET